MKSALKIIGLLILLIGNTFCTDDENNDYGTVLFEVYTPQKLRANTAEVTVKAVLYEESTKKQINLDLGIVSVANGKITTKSAVVEEGMFGIKQLEVLSKSGSQLHVSAIEQDSLMAMVKYVEAGRLTTFSLIAKSTGQPEQPRPEDNIGISEPYSYDFKGYSNFVLLQNDGWTNYRAIGTDKNWYYDTSVDFGTAYAEVSASNGNSESYELWMLSPALNLDAVEFKTISFNSSQGFSNGATLNLYIMDSANPTEAKLKDKLTYTVAKAFVGGYDPNYTYSGVIDLSAYSGDVYIGFQYVAEAGQTSTFKVDDFHFAKEEL